MDAPVNCTNKKCDGALFNVTSRLALSLGVLHLQCEKCKQIYVHQVVKHYDERLLRRRAT